MSKKAEAKHRARYTLEFKGTSTIERAGYFCVTR
jgi:hypothetical protein